ncbi:MAG: hypothetical protein R2854_00890 [Caldilineaceae bacterium]
MTAATVTATTVPGWRTALGVVANAVIPATRRATPPEAATDCSGNACARTSAGFAHADRHAGTADTDTHSLRDGNSVADGPSHGHRSQP